MAGYGECVAMETPFFNHETIDTAWLMTTKHIVPLLEAKRITSAAQVRDALAPIRENRMAKAGVEAAIWDLEAKQAEQPLWRYIGGTRTDIACGVSIGLQDSTAALLDKVSDALECGYQRIKIKIKPGKDVHLVDAVRGRFPDITLSVDANAAYSLVTDSPVFARLDEFGLLMIEQPLAPGDLVDHAKLQRSVRHVDLSRRIHREPGTGATRSRIGRVPNHQHQIGPRRGIQRGKGHSGIHASARHAGVVRWNAGSGHRPRSQHRPLDAVRLHAAGRYRRFGKVLARGHRRAAGNGESSGNDHRANRVWHRFRSQRSPRRGADGSP